MDTNWHRRVRIRAAAACVLFLAVFGLGASSIRHFAVDIAAVEQYCGAEEDAEARKREEKCQSLLYRTISDPAGFFTAGLLSVTVGLTVATYWLYRVAVTQSLDAKDAIQAARESSEKQLRAYLQLKYARWCVVDEKFTTELCLSNCGQTPAHNVIGRPRLVYRDELTKAEVVEDFGDRIYGTIGPNLEPIMKLVLSRRIRASPDRAESEGVFTGGSI